MLRLLAPLAVLLLLAACDEVVTLMAAVPEEEANEVLGILLEAGINSRKTEGKEGMAAVSVDADRVADAIQTLRAHGLPRERFPGMGAIFKKEGLISSPFEEKVRYVYALSQDLQTTLRQIDGVIAARVHVVLPEQGSGGDEAVTPASAAVFIKYNELYDLERVVPQIKRLVVNSIQRLNPDKVSVVLVAATHAPAGGGAATANDSVLTFAVARDDSARLRGVLVGLAGMALAGLAAAGAMFWLWRGRDLLARWRGGETPR